MYAMRAITDFCRNLFLVSLLICHKTSSQYNNFDYQDQDEITYYENLITDNMQAAFEAADVPLDASMHAPFKPGTLDYGTYDYIIIGAGSAGATAASRLSENPKSNILLLEAGGGETDFSDIPNLHYYLQGLSFNWNYNSTPQTTCCLGNIDQICAYPRGKVLGGSSTINTLIYVRGNRVDYDQWAEQGNPGWSYDDVLPLFRKSENAVINGDPGYHGVGGYWNVEIPTLQAEPILDAFLGANQELGLQVLDYNGERQLGASPCQFNNVNGRRHSAAKAFLGPALDRKNLEISIHSYVIKVMIDPHSKKAEGVLFTKNGQLYVARALKEVILSGGVFASPAILMHSGVGPAHHLEQLGIPVIQDLPVGERLYDHPNFVGTFIQLNYTEPYYGLRENIRQYLQGMGPLSISLNSQGLSFYKIDPYTHPDQPDLELLLVPPNSTSLYTARSFKFNDDVTALLNTIDPQSTMNIQVIGLHPKSYGSVRLASNNPFDYPLIDANYLSDPEGYDIEMLYQGIQVVMNLVNTQSFQKYGATMIPLNLPACMQYVPYSKDYWYCTIRQLTNNLYHPTSTCRMGPDPKNSVVDNKMRVHGIKNLRIADASIYPFSISGHTGAPTVMIGEKLATVIQEGQGQFSF